MNTRRTMRLLVAGGLVLCGGLTACTGLVPFPLPGMPKAPVASPTVEPSPVWTEGDPQERPSDLVTPSEAATPTWGEPSIEPEKVPPPQPPPAPSPVVSPKPKTSTVKLRTYRNARFGFSCLVPSGWSGRESANGDGITVRRPDGRAEVRCWGSHVPSSPREYKRSFVSSGYRVTYERVTSNMVTLAGTKGSTIKYVRYEFGGGREIAMQWVYPASEKAAFDDPVTKAARALG